VNFTVGESASDVGLEEGMEDCGGWMMDTTGGIGFVVVFGGGLEVRVEFGGMSLGYGRCFFLRAIIYREKKERERERCKFLYWNEIKCENSPNSWL